MVLFCVSLLVAAASAPLHWQLWVQVGAGSLHTFVALAAGMVASVLYAYLKAPLFDSWAKVAQLHSKVRQGPLCHCSEPGPLHTDASQHRTVTVA